MGKDAALEELIDEELNEDTNLEDGDLESGDTSEEEDVSTEEEDTSDEENEEEEEDESKDEDENSDDAKDVKFDKKQQAEVNKLIKARLDRADAKLERDLSKAAGIEISNDELPSAARLWGLLKANPKLSRDIDGLIAMSLSDGSAKAPDAAEHTVEAVTQRLELKEAILDLKAADTKFSKNAEKILAWADKEGYAVKDAKSLKLAYLAWKGTQGKVEEALQKKTIQRKQEDKKLMQKRASVQSAKPGSKSVGKTDYRKMSDSAVLASEGLSLFTDD